MVCVGVGLVGRAGAIVFSKVYLHACYCETSSFRRVMSCFYRVSQNVLSPKSHARPTKYYSRTTASVNTNANRCALRIHPSAKIFLETMTPCEIEIRSNLAVITTFVPEPFGTTFNTTFKCYEARPN